MKRCLSVVVVLSLVVSAPAALARVGVSGAAKASLVHTALGAKTPRQCAAAYISSVDRFWAAVFFKPAKGWGARCRTIAHKGWTALHHTHGRWQLSQYGQSAACVSVHVPVAIRKDLQIPCYPLIP